MWWWLGAEPSRRGSWAPGGAWALAPLLLSASRLSLTHCKVPYSWPCAAQPSSPSVQAKEAIDGRMFAGNTIEVAFLQPQEFMDAIVPPELPPLAPLPPIVGAAAPAAPEAAGGEAAAAEEAAASPAAEPAAAPAAGEEAAAPVQDAAEAAA